MKKKTNNKVSWTDTQKDMKTVKWGWGCENGGWGYGVGRYKNDTFCFCSELIDGIAVYDENNNKITESRYAAIKGISQVTFSRILMATPGMSEYFLKKRPIS